MKLIVLIVFLLLPLSAYAQPFILFETEAHDFGEVKQGTHLEHVFEFSNSGAGELSIERLVTP